MTDQRETLCYLCQNSNRNGCSWARSLEPVKGWDAEENNQGYLVLWCPEFKKETPETILPDDLDRDGMMNLLEAMARQMREDYVKGTGKYTTNDLHKHSLKQEDFAKLRRMNREAIEKWIKHGPGRMLLQLSNPDEVITMLRKLARRYEQELLTAWR